ncbi:hypothetical protein Tco_0020054 [Tanacetum coccineum]
MTESPFVDSGFVVPVFSPGDDLIACLIKAMAFLMVVASSRFLLPIISSEPLLIQETKPLFKMVGLSCNKFRGDKGKIIPVIRIRAMLLVQGEMLQVGRQELLSATIVKVKDIWLGNDLDTYDSDDDLSTAQAVLMANISNYGSDIILEVPNSETYLNDMENQSVHAFQDFEQSPVMDFTDNEISSDSNIIPYSQYLQETQ